MTDCRQLVWIGTGAVVGFLSSFIFGDLSLLPLDLYYLIYFAIVISFFLIYIRRTHPDLKKWFSKRLLWGVVLGLIFSAIMVSNVLSRPRTSPLSGAYLVWSILWRGLVYGAIDGFLLSVFPWMVTWRAFRAEEKTLVGKAGVALLSWVFIVLMTTAYHVGYADFRSTKIVQADIGNTIMSIPTLLSANPVGSPIAHAALHVAAVVHSPGTELFLPPHREKFDRQP